MSDHNDAAAATFPHDAIARMRQLQQLASRDKRVNQKSQENALSSVRQHSAAAAQ